MFTPYLRTPERAARAGGWTGGRTDGRAGAVHFTSAGTVHGRNILLLYLCILYGTNGGHIDAIPISGYYVRTHKEMAREHLGACAQTMLIDYVEMAHGPGAI